MTDRAHTPKEVAKQLCGAAIAGTVRPRMLLLLGADTLDAQAAEVAEAWARAGEAQVERDAARDERDALRAALREAHGALAALIDALSPEVGEKGAGGYLLARLSDARSVFTRLAQLLDAPPSDAESA